MQQFQLITAGCCRFKGLKVFFSLQCNGCLSQHLLSKEGGWEEEEVQQFQLITAGCCHFTLHWLSQLSKDGRGVGGGKGRRCNNRLMTDALGPTKSGSGEFEK